jgi:hypothetical protein
MKVGSDLLVPDSSKVLLYRGLRPVYFALKELLIFCLALEGGDEFLLLLHQRVRRVFVLLRSSREDLL